MNDEARPSAAPPTEKKRRSPDRAVRLSPRGAFVVRELLKARCMTMNQIARLCRVERSSGAALDLCRRLRALGYIVVAYPFQDRTTAVVSLSEQGRRFARDRLGRSLEKSGRDDGRSTAQVLRVSELYVRLVSLGASDWIASRANADRFEWHDGGDVPDLAAIVPTLDAALDTGSHRYLIDGEPIIASERGFASKIERYSRTVAGDRSHTLVLLTDKAGVRFVRHWLADNRNADGPSVFAGDLDQTVALLSSAIGLGPAVAAAPSLGGNIVAELRTFLTHIIKRSGLSSTRWPPNWRTVMSAVYGAEEWKTLGPKLKERAAGAAARQQPKPGDNA